MIVEMAETGAGVLICSKPQWVDEIVARELGMTLISIDHYISDRYGLQPMQKILTTKFPQIHTMICENLEMRQLDSLFQDLVNIALRDRKISEDEKILIKSLYLENDSDRAGLETEKGDVFPFDKHELGDFLSGQRKNIFSI